MTTVVIKDDKHGVITKVLNKVEAKTKARESRPQ